MNSNRKTTIIVGVLYIAGTVAGIISLVIGPNLNASYFQTLATLLLAVREWGDGVFAVIVFSLSALILNYILYRSELIPRLLSEWGLIGAILYLGSGFLPLLGHDPRSTIFILMEAPLGLWEMVFAVWLIVKGFNPSAIASTSVKQI